MVFKSKEFYKKLGVKKLSERITKQRTKKYLEKIISFFKKDDKILDLACGYGRITIPLAKRGYNVSGLDISPNLLNHAKKEAIKNKFKIDFKLGDMRKLPYQDGTFDKIVCLWSSFNEIISEKDQLKVVNEIYRVLKQNGLAFIEVFDGEGAYWKDKKVPKNRVYTVDIDGLKTKHYIHTRKTLANLAIKSKFKKYDSKFIHIDRRRIALILIK